MTMKKFYNRLMDNARGSKLTKLEANKLEDVKLSGWKSIHPATKFGQVMFLYRLTDLERRELGVQLDNPGVIAVVE